jgi:hypothetical protein
MNVLDHVYIHHDDGDEDDVGQDDEGPGVEELMHNFAPHVLLQCRNISFDNFETLDKMWRDHLYEECKECDKEHTVLWMTFELLKLKASNGWSDNSFSTLLEFLTKVLPKLNDLPSNTYLAKKIIYPLTLSVEKIHACPNNCILYRKEYGFKEKYPTCNASRYKQNDVSEEESCNNKRQGRKRKNVAAPPDQDIQGSKERKVPTLVIWYLLVIDRLKRMFSNPRDAQLLLWHVNRKMDGKIWHPANGRQ